MAMHLGQVNVNQTVGHRTQAVSRLMMRSSFPAGRRYGQGWLVAASVRDIRLSEVPATWTWLRELTSHRHHASSTEVRRSRGGNFGGIDPLGKAHPGVLRIAY
jgi:hypothetical protein